MAERPLLQRDFCILGGGAAGLSAAAGAAQLGLSVALVEGASLGGDCLKTGCVPSKALLASAARAEAVRQAAAYGVSVAGMEVDFPAVMARLQAVQQGVGVHDGQARFEQLGCDVIRGWGRFTGRDAITVTCPDGERQKIRFRRALIATGSRPVWPWAEAKPWNGQADPDHCAGHPRLLTTDSLFCLTTQPDHLIIIGGGPVGCEMAQAFRRLGSRVTVVAPALLPGEDPDLVAVLAQRLRGEGITLILRDRLSTLNATPDLVTIVLESGMEISGSHLLGAVGRAVMAGGPEDPLGLRQAGIGVRSDGAIVHDGAFQTANPCIYVAGDAAGMGALSHLAGAQAASVLRRAIFGLPCKAPEGVPHVTYCDPEVAQVGMTAALARERGLKVKLLDVSLADVGRYHTDYGPDKGTEDGKPFMRLVLGRGSQILGAGIVGPHAGELIALWTAAVAGKLSLADVAGMVMPYPTLSEALKHAAGQHYAPRLFSPLGRRLARWGMVWGDFWRSLPLWGR